MRSVRFSFSSNQITQLLYVSNGSALSSVVPASTPACPGKTLWQSTINPRSTPGPASPFCGQKVNLLNQHEGGVDVVLNAPLSINVAHHTLNSVSLTASRNDAGEIFIHIYIQKFCFAGA